MFKELLHMVLMNRVDMNVYSFLDVRMHPLDYAATSCLRVDDVVDGGTRVAGAAELVCIKVLRLLTDERVGGEGANNGGTSAARIFSGSTKLHVTADIPTMTSAPPALALASGRTASQSF